MNRDRVREILFLSIQRELSPGASIPSEGEDLIDSGALDSMGWVGLVRALETATDQRDFADRIPDGTRSIKTLMEILENADEAPSSRSLARSQGNSRGIAIISGWSSATGSKVIEISRIEHEFSLPAAKLGKGAGIVSVAHVARGEDEVSLVAKPCEEALSHAGLEIGDVDTLIATSETQLGFPALAARLHARLLARADCAALDVGGGCLGLVNAFHVAKSLLLSGAAACVLVATSDVHSHVLTPPRVKGQFGGLFGDGASAFVLQPGSDGRSHDRYILGEFLFGCQPAYATAIQISLDTHQSYHLRFDGEALARAAVEQLEQTIEDLELRSGVKRDAAAAFATHQPNPRLVDLLARRLRVPREKFPEVARVSGNLGSSTCGVALCRALTKQTENGNIPHAPIFLASLGPGLLWGGAVVH